MIAALRYEWVRVTTVRSTRISLVITFLGVALLAWLGSTPVYTSFDDTGSPVGPPTVAWWDAFSQPLLFAAIFASVVAAQNIGQEYRFGLIRLTLTAFPQRGRMVTAKIASVVATGVVFALVSYAASWVGVTVRGYPAPPPEAPPVDSTYLLRGVLFMALWALSAWALAGITRQTAIGIAVPVVSGFIVEQIVGGLLAERAPWVRDILPWSTGTRWSATAEMFGGGDPTRSVPPVGWAAIVVFGAWVLVLVVLEVVSFLRRDA